MTINTTEQYDNMTISQYNSTTIWQCNTTDQYDNMTISQYNNTTIWKYNMHVCTFICNENFMIRHENINKLVRIDNIQSASDHRMNHFCKLVIESETLVLFVWWTQYEFRQMNTACNYLEDGIWIADDVRVDESSISMAVIISRMYVALLGLGDISIIWRPLCSHCVSLRMLSSLNTFFAYGLFVSPHSSSSSF